MYSFFIFLAYYNLHKIKVYAILNEIGVISMKTVYQKIAKAALMRWHNLTNDEANEIINNESFNTIEKKINAMGSIKYAISEIAKQINLNNNEIENFINAIINESENAEIFNLIKLKVKNLSNEQILVLLSSIHNGWVHDNSNENIFNKKKKRKQLRQYAKIDLIGWNEVESDLLFLIPILQSIGIIVDENILKQFYYNKNSYYLNKMNINNKGDLSLLVSQGTNYYPELPKVLEEKLIPLSNAVATQIIQNWYNLDLQSAINFDTRLKNSNNETKKK